MFRLIYLCGEMKESYWSFHSLNMKLLHKYSSCVCPDFGLECEGISMQASCEEWWIVCSFPSSFRMICHRHRRTDASSIELSPTSLPFPRSRSIARSDDYGYRVNMQEDSITSQPNDIVLYPSSSYLLFKPLSFVKEPHKMNPMCFKTAKWSHNMGSYLNDVYTIFGIMDPLPLVCIQARSLVLNPRNLPYHVCIWAAPCPLLV